jgi:hypothetical protein
MAAPALNVAMAARSVVSMGDDEHGKGERSTVPSLLSYEERYERSSTRQQRTKAKITVNEIRANVVKRVDVGAEIMCIMLAVDQMQRGEFESWIALKEGVLFERKPKRSRKPGRRAWHVIPPPARSATAEQTARHYGYTERSVVEMDRRARKALSEIREAAGLMGDNPAVPVWPAVMSQRNMMRHLFG